MLSITQVYVSIFRLSFQTLALTLILSQELFSLHLSEGWPEVYSSWNNKPGGCRPHGRGKKKIKKNGQTGSATSFLTAQPAFTNTPLYSSRYKQQFLSQWSYAWYASLVTASKGLFLRVTQRHSRKTFKHKTLSFFNRGGRLNSSLLLQWVQTTLKGFLWSFLVQRIYKKNTFHCFSPKFNVRLIELYQTCWIHFRTDETFTKLMFSYLKSSALFTSMFTSEQSSSSFLTRQLNVD